MASGTRFLRVCSIFGSSILWLWAAPGLSEAAKWNQERVTAYGREMAEAAAELKAAAMKEPVDATVTLTVSQARALDEFKEAVNLLGELSSDLAQGLKAGKGRDETTPSFRRIEKLRREIEESSQRTVITDPVLDRIIKTGAALLKMIPYYESQ